MPEAAIRESRSLRKRSNTLAAALHAAFNRYRSDDFSTMMLHLLPVAVSLLDDAQSETARMAADNAPTAMRDMDGGMLFEASYEPDVSQWVGVNGNGYDTIPTLYEPVIEAKRGIARGWTLNMAFNHIETGMITRARTCLTDTQHGVSMVTAKGRYPQARLVRVLNPPSCGRCVILAGTSNTCERHPNCDCTAMWSHDIPKDAYPDPYSYLNELVDSGDMDGLARVLGSRANAQAYLDGADLNQLVNAYRHGGVRTAQIGGRRITYTTEGTTKRGHAAYAMTRAGYAREYVRNGGKTLRLDRPRLMPETIYDICEHTGADPRTMLRDYGWILD